jgi:hypothetical protein
MYTHKHAIGTHNNQIYPHQHAIYTDNHKIYTHKHLIYTRGNGLINAPDCARINTNENSMPCLAAVGNFTGNSHCFDAASL